MRDKRPFSVYLQLPAIKKQVLETANRFDVDAARRVDHHDESRYTGFLCTFFFRPMGDKRGNTWDVVKRISSLYKLPGIAERGKIYRSTRLIR